MNINSLIRENIKSLKPYSSARDEFKEFSSSLIFLDANENPFDNGVNRYPDPQQVTLKSKLSEIKNISIDNILLGNGSDEVLDLIFRVFCEPNRDNIITLPPTYGMYEVLANTNAIEVKSVSLNNNFQPDVDVILAKVDSNSKVIFLCSPNNPTANCFNSNLTEKLLRQFNGIVVIDEAYIEFSKEESWLSRLNEFPNLIVTQTLSKAYGLAGIRLGVCYSSKEIISTLNRIKPPYNINALTQQKALERLLNVGSVKEQIATIIDQRDKLIQKLTTIKFVYKVYPSDANFVLVKVDDATKRYNQLLEKGIVVRNRTNQPNCENCLRFTVGTALENSTLIKTLKNIQ